MQYSEGDEKWDRIPVRQLQEVRASSSVNFVAGHSQTFLVIGVGRPFIFDADSCHEAVGHEVNDREPNLK
jgi:hypothetical protein